MTNSDSIVLIALIEIRDSELNTRVQNSSTEQHPRFLTETSSQERGSPKRLLSKTSYLRISPTKPQQHRMTKLASDIKQNQLDEDIFDEIILTELSYLRNLVHRNLP